MAETYTSLLRGVPVGILANFIIKFNRGGSSRGIQDKARILK